MCEFIFINAASSFSGNIVKCVYADLGYLLAKKVLRKNLSSHTCISSVLTSKRERDREGKFIALRVIIMSTFLDRQSGASVILPL